MVRKKKSRQITKFMLETKKGIKLVKGSNLGRLRYIG
jgi:hypothetical protein